MVAQNIGFAISIDDFVVTNFVSGTSNTFPIWVSLLSWPLYRRSPGLKVFVAVLIGVAGVALVVLALGVAYGAIANPDLPRRLIAACRTQGREVFVLALEGQCEVDGFAAVGNHHHADGDEPGRQQQQAVGGECRHHRGGTLMVGEVDLRHRHQAEADPGVGGFTEQRARPGRQITIIRQVVQRHQLDRLAAENARAIQFAAVQQHGVEAMIVKRSGNQPTAAG